jgi:HAE1 family hydrophobic/amphiphilic exporter-1
MLWLTGQRLGVPSMMGLIILVGVSVNNAIVLVDAINRYLAEGAHLEEAILTAARNRIRPILMTSLTTIFGLIPLALSRGEGSEMQIPLAIGFMGGMISSTVLTLFFIPVMYKGLYRLIRKPAAPTATVEM